MSDSKSELENQRYQGFDSDSDEIEILEVVGLDEDSPADQAIEPSLAGDSVPEYVLDLDDGEPRPEPSEESAEAIEATYRERLARLQADLDNFKKRVERERQEHVDLATNGVVTRLLPVLDNFERALGSAHHDSPEAMMDGVTLIFRQLLDELRKEGLSAIEAVGQPFDPNLHDALETTSASGQSSYVVIQELQRGYKLHGRLLRPALVKVAPAEDEEPDSPDPREPPKTQP